MYDMKLRRKNDDGKPVLANMAIPANAKYQTIVVQEYLATLANNNTKYYRILVDDEPSDDDEEPAHETKYDESFGLGLDDAEEPADETKYDESFGVNFFVYSETVKENKANDLVAAATNEDGKAFAQTKANDGISNEDGVAFMQTQATNDGGGLQRRDETATTAQEAPETK